MTDILSEEEVKASPLEKEISISRQNIGLCRSSFRCCGLWTPTPILKKENQNGLVVCYSVSPYSNPINLTAFKEESAWCLMAFRKADKSLKGKTSGQTAGDGGLLIFNPELDNRY